MTKIDALLTSSEYNSPIKKLDTWLILGGSVIRGDRAVQTATYVYSKDTLYLLDDPNSSYDGSLIFCEKELIDSKRGINWDNLTVLDGTKGYVSFGNDIISPNFRMVLSFDEAKKTLDSLGIAYSLGSCGKAIKNGYLEPTTEIAPFVELTSAEDNNVVHIEDDDYLEIMSCLGSPFIRDEELEYTRDEICRLAIKPALLQYFKWCPPARPEEISVTCSRQVVDMPTDAYGVVGLSLQQMGGSTMGDVTNPFMYAYQQSIYGGITNYNGTSISSLGSGMTNIMRNGTNTILSNRAVAQAYTNYSRRVHYEGPYKNDDGSKYIVVYSNVQGMLNIWWGLKSLDFNDVEFGQRENAILMAQAKVMLLFGYLRRQSKSDIPGQVSYEYLIEEGNKIWEAQETIMKDIVKSSGILRGSL